MARARRPVRQPIGGAGSTPLRPPTKLTTNVNVIDRTYVPRKKTGWRKWNGLEWTAASSNPALGNGTLKGWYRFDDRWLDVYVELVAGSTTTFGTGAWVFSGGLTAVPMTSHVTGHGSFYDSSGPTPFFGFCRFDATGELRPFTHATGTTGAGVAVTSSSPFTWATGDEMTIEARYRYTN